MTPEEKALLEELKRKVEDLENGRGLEFFLNLEDRIYVSRPNFPDAVSGSSSGDFINNTTIGMGGGTVTHLKAPEFLLQVRYKGKTYLVPAYTIR